MKNEDNLMNEMRAKYYPYHEQNRNLKEALEFIKKDMERGLPFTEFWTYWTDLPDDWVVEMDTLDKLKEQGFTIRKRTLVDGKTKKEFAYYYVVSWDEYEQWPNEEEY